MIDKIIEDLKLQRDAEVLMYPTDEVIQEHKEQCDFLIALLEKQKNNDWIFFTQRELTEEEKEEMDTDYDYILDCKLPEDNQEILVCYKDGYVDIDTFFSDCGCYLDSGRELIDDIIAWMPKPAAPVHTRKVAKNND